MFYNSDNRHRTRRGFLVAALSLALPLLSVGCSPRAGVEPQASAVMAVDVADGAAAQLRRAYLGRDWWACARDGAGLQRVHPQSARVQAWAILCVARSGVDAVPLADAMLAARPGEPWALFARAGALIDHPSRGKQEAIPAARAALEAMPGEPDAVWQLGRALVVHARASETAAFFAAQPRPAPAELVALELAFAIQSPEVTESRVLELADQARAADPDNVDAEFAAASWQLGNQRAAEAVVSLRRALDLSPHAPALHAQLWQAIRQSGGGDAADVRAAIDADVALLLLHRGDAPAALAAAANVYEDMSPETHKKFTAELLARFPTSTEADWARFGQILALDHARYERRERGAADPAADAELLRHLDAFLAGPVTVTRLLGDVYRMRHALVREAEDVAPEVLLAAVRDWAPHEQFNFGQLAEAVAELSARTGYHAEAEAVARLALARAEALVGPVSDPTTIDDDTGSLLSAVDGALGATLLAQGRRAEADEVLARGRALKHRAPRFLVQLAALAEADGKIAEAEQLLVEGLPLWGGAEICEDALKQLYRRQHGSDRGYAAHRLRLEAGAREQRRAALLATAIAEPKTLPPFALAKLGGGELRSEALGGKVVVINFWGVSCHPCVAEMPALQQLADAFAGSSDVVVATINIDSETDDLAAWMTAHALRLEVLLGGRYFNDSGYRGIPLTLFVDDRGRVVFTQEGATARLVEEFTWRIEALRERATGPERAALRAAG